MPKPAPRRTIVWDARTLDADLTTVDALARLQLAARRTKAELRLRQPSAELLALLALVGLDTALRVESRRQAE
jgi:hypothetical protein